MPGALTPSDLRTAPGAIARKESYAQWRCTRKSSGNAEEVHGSPCMGLNGIKAAFLDPEFSPRVVPQMVDRLKTATD